MINKRANNQLQIETVTYTDQELQMYSKLVFNAHNALKDIIEEAYNIADIACVDFHFEFRKRIAMSESIERTMKKMIGYAKKNLPTQKDLDQFDEDMADMCKYLDEVRRDYRENVL